MPKCEYLISKDIDVNCSDPVVPGLEPNGIIINRSDIDFGSTVFDTSRENVIKTLALTSGAKAYSIAQAGNTPFTGTQVELATGTYRNTFTNTVSLVVLDNDPDVNLDIIDKLANGEFVVILENKYKGLKKDSNAGDAAFQVFGWYQGLKASEMTNDKYSEDTEGGWAVTLQETKAPKSGMYVYNTDYDTTKKAIDSLT